MAVSIPVQATNTLSVTLLQSHASSSSDFLNRFDPHPGNDRALVVTNSSQG
jgi:hypothetical protein